MKVKNILVDQQSGFRANRGTHENLVFLTQKVAETLERGRICVAVLYDIAKAFDKVWHAGLLKKLVGYVVPNYVVCWIMTF